MKRSGDTAQILTLSLFMIVLAFFIVLNSLSDFRQGKVIPVMASLEAEFSSKMAGSESGASLSGTKKDPELFSGGEINDLEVAFKNNFDVLATKMNTAGTVLQVEMNRRNFLDILRKSNTIGFLELRKKLLLFMNNASQPYRLDVVFNEKDPLTSSLEDQKNMPALLIKTGFVHGNFKISTRKGDPELISLVFSPQSKSLMSKEDFE